MRAGLTLGDATGQTRAVTLTVEPLEISQGKESLYLILFEAAGSTPESGGLTQDRAEMQADEVREVQDRLQSTIEEYETALEELKSSNEELISVNEEAQSTNEELEASKEEMQSLNEEMNTINAELSAKVEELDNANADLKNLYESSQIATVFLDRNLVIRNFTPAASQYFHLREADIGRPLMELATALEYPELKSHIAAVFESGEMIEHRIAGAADDAAYMVRLIPYRKADRNIDGVVVTLIDVSSLARAEAHQKVLIAELNHRVKNMLAVVVSIVNHTLRDGVSQELRRVLADRLHAMSRSFAMLSRQSWKHAILRELIEQEVAAHGAERVTLEGPRVSLTPKQALAMGMVMHELATNAVKYGALSQDGGSVAVRWSRDGPDLCLSWVESGGPDVKTPEQMGFGFVLLQGQIEYQLSGSIETSFSAQGFELRLRIPMSPQEGEAGAGNRAAEKRR